MDILFPKNDEYFNEYINQSSDRLKFISNFSGSAGFALILKKKIICLLMEDIQFKQKFNLEKILKLLQFLKNFQRCIKKKKNSKIGFDPKLHSENN